MSIERMSNSTLPVELEVILTFISNSILDLDSCGIAPLNLFNKTVSLLYQPTNKNLAQSILLASSLLRLSNEKILSYNYKDVPDYWRRMFTDATILKVLAILVQTDIEREDILNSMKELDMVIIVAGVPGEGRSNIVFKLITLFQSKLSLQSSMSSTHPSPKRQKLTTTNSIHFSPPQVHNSILRLSASPTIAEFHQLLHRPFIITSGCSDWPAAKLWSLSYLKSISEGRVVPVEVGGNYTAGNWSQKIIPFATFLDSLSQVDKEEEKLYLAQHDLFRQFPILEKDIIIPDFVYCLPDQVVVEHKAPTSGIITNAWLGPEGTLSPPHFDPYFNCFQQVLGKKWIWIAPPSVSDSSLYTFGSPDSPSSPSLSDGEEDSSTSHYMTNTSRIDVTLPSDSPLLKKFPKYLKNVVPVAEQAILEPGDLLFMPPGWWHSMKSLEVSFSVSIWF